VKTLSLCLLPVLFSFAFADAPDDFGGALGGTLSELRALKKNPAAAAAPAPASKDLSGQFSRGRRNAFQGTIGDCHDFAVTALFEAAMFRQRCAFPSGISNADLFIQNTMLRADVALNAQLDSGGSGPPAAQDYYKLYLAGGAGRATEVPDESENNLKVNVDFVLDRGLVSEEAVPYDRFLREYTQSERPAIERDMAAADSDAAAMEKRYGLDPNQKILVYGRTPAASAPTIAQARREAAMQTQIGVSQRARIDKFLSSLDMARIARERSQSLASMRGFHYVRWSAPYAKPDAPPARNLSKSECAAQGRPQFDFLAAELGKDRPVAVKFDLAGMKGWFFESLQKRASHGIVIDGFHSEGGAVVFSTLNSWGPQGNLPFPADQVCRISEMISVRVPSDPD
jgi:hypothetical protein